MTPPNGATNSVAIPIPVKTTPTEVFFPVMSNATTLWTIQDMLKARNEKAVPNQSIRK